MATFFTDLAKYGGDFITFLTSLFSNIWAMFYTEASGWTDIGKFVLISISISFVFFGIRFIKRLIHLRG